MANEKTDYVTDYYHPYTGVILRCTKCGYQVKKNEETRFCGGCGSEMNISRDHLYKGHFQALDNFAKD